ncbi:MAG: tRNA (guanosine(18)-2'-O)-methyltransferase TrmH [Deltaproteobacteria bacterium]|nr:tRNA (guanosine(18)-2'-O)-methyltransferase TrmH [Deltaproteobacteria bacterium]
MGNQQRFAKIAAVLRRRQPDLTVVMDNVHKPHNLAAIARTCDAVGIQEVHAVSADHGIRLTQRAASGCRKWITIRSHRSIADAYRELRRRGFRLYAAHLDDRARDFREIDYTAPTAIVVGAELDGLSPAAAAGSDGTLIIPLAGFVQSLNVSVATALILFEAYRQRQAAGFYDHCRLDGETYRRLLFEWLHPKVAAYCRRHQLPYPALDDRGEISEPLANDHQRRQQLRPGRKLP